MSLVKVKALREERAKLVADAQAILVKAEQISKDEEARFDKMMADADSIKANIDRLEKVMSAEHELSQRVEQRAGRDNISISDAKNQDEQESTIFKKWLLGGMQDLNDQERRVMQRRAAPVIQAAQSVGTTTAGGFLVPQSFSDRLEIALKYYSGMMENAEVTGAHLRATEVAADPVDRATLEEEHALELRVRDRERKLLKKIESTLRRLDDGSYGYCEETGEPIGLKRLLARPTATLSLEAQERRENLQRVQRD